MLLHMDHYSSHIKEFNIEISTFCYIAIFQKYLNYRLSQLKYMKEGYLSITLKSTTDLF